MNLIVSKSKNSATYYVLNNRIKIEKKQVFFLSECCIFD